MSYHYNDQTKHADITAELVERDERNNKSVWDIKLNENILIDIEHERYLKAGTTFKHEGCYDDEKLDIEGYIYFRGIQATCNISDYEIEARLEEL